MELVRQLWLGGGGPRWSLTRVRALLERSRRALARCKPWMPTAAWRLISQGLAATESEADAHAAAYRSAPADSLPAAMPAAYAFVSGTVAVPTCAACGKRAMQLKKCAACKAVAYW